MQFSSAITGFKISLAADRYSPRTISAYSDHLTFISKYLGNPDVESVTESDLRSFFGWLNSEYQPHRSNGDTHPLAGSSVNKVWIALRSFFGWCESESLVTSRPDRAIRQPVFATKSIIPFSLEETQRLLKSCQKSRNPKRNVAILLTLLDTGVRSGELCRLTISDVDLESGSVVIRPFGSSIKSRPRTVFVGRATRRALWRYLAISGTSRDDSLFGVTVNGLRLLCARLGATAGVAGCHPHRFRHTFALNFLRNSGDALSLQRLLGHSSLLMTEKYVALADSDLASISSNASPVDNWRL